MSKTALLLIDIQNDYFQGGKFPLNEMDAALKQSAKLLDAFRKNNLSVIYVRHETLTTDAPFFHKGSDGACIHSTLTPKDSEPVITKHNINSFKDTNLKEILDAQGVETVVIVGAMSHMCIDAVTRAASDFGYNCAIAHDACTTLDLEFNDIKIPAQMAHAAFMSALGFAYANVATTDELLNQLNLA